MSGFFVPPIFVLVALRCCRFRTVVGNPHHLLPPTKTKEHFSDTGHQRHQPLWRVRYLYSAAECINERARSHDALLLVQRAVGQLFGLWRPSERWLAKMVA